MVYINEVSMLILGFCRYHNIGMANKFGITLFRFHNAGNLFQASLFSMFLCIGFAHYLILDIFSMPLYDRRGGHGHMNFTFLMSLFLLMRACLWFCNYFTVAASLQCNLVYVWFMSTVLNYGWHMTNRTIQVLYGMCEMT